MQTKLVTRDDVEEILSSIQHDNWKRIVDAHAKAYKKRQTIQSIVGLGFIGLIVGAVYTAFIM